jgi:tape measure domain-containing protein
MILERLVVAIDADLKGLRDITAGAARMERNVERNMTRAGVAADHFGDRIQGVGQKLTLGLSVPLAALGVVTVVTAGKMDQLRRGLDSVTGSGQETARQLQRLREVSKLPGLGFEEAVRGSINLQAAGFSAGLAEKSLRGFGNALASVGRGRAELDGVILALGQMAAKGKIMAQEVNQLAERVPQIRKVMEAAFGTADTEKLQKMGLDATTFVSEVVEQLLLLPPVTTGIANSFENITDQSKNTAASWGDRLVPATAGLLNSGSDLLGVLERMPPALKDVAIGGAVAAGALGPLALGAAALVKLGPVIIAQWGVLASVSGPILGVAAAIGAVTAAGLALSNNWPTISYEVTRLADALRDRLTPATQDLTAAWDKLNETTDPKLRTGTSGTSQDLLNSLRFGGAPGQGKWGVPLVTPAASASTSTGPSPIPFHVTAEAVDMLLERQKKLQEESAKLRLDLKLAEGTAAADSLQAKLGEVAQELGRVNALLNTSSGKTWSALKGFMDANALAGPVGLLDGRGFQLPKQGSKTGLTLTLDPKTGLREWKRITENGIPIVMPDVNPLTGKPQGTGAESANWLDDIGKQFGDIGSRLLDPKIVASNLATQGITALSGWVFGQVGSMLFGGTDRNEALREQVRQLERNSDRLEQLRDGLATLDTALLGEKGGTISGVAKAIGAWLNNTQFADPNVRGGGLQGVLAYYGASMEDLTRLAQRFGIELDGSARSFEQLQTALESDFLRNLTGTFEGAFGLMRQEFDLLDITDPMEQFQRSIDLVASLVSDDLASTLRGLDASGLDALISDTLDRLRLGDVTLFNELGALSINEFLEFLGFAEGALDRFGDTANKATEALRNAPSGFKVNLSRFQADAGVMAMPVRSDPGGGSPTISTMMARASAAGPTFTGPIYVQANDPAEFLSQLESQVQWRSRTGASVIQTSTRRGG